MTLPLTVERALFVPRELVFSAWTDPDQLVEWYVPDDATDCSADVTARPGGAFAVTWRDAGGETEETGRFASVTPPQAFRLELRLVGPKIDSGPTVVELELVDEDGASAIRLWQGAVLPAGESRSGDRSHGLGRLERLWVERLDRLEGYFSVI